MPLIALLLGLAAFLAAAALTVAIVAALAATGWGPAAIGVSVVAFQLLVLLVAVAAPLLRRTNAALVLIASGILLAGAELVVPLGRAFPATPQNVTALWTLGAVLASAALPALLVVTAAATARGLLRPPAGEAPRWRLLRIEAAGALIGIAASVLLAAFPGADTLRNLWEVGAYVLAATAVVAGVLAVRSQRADVAVKAAPDARSMSNLLQLDSFFLALAPAALLLGVLSYAAPLVPSVPFLWGVALLAYFAGWLVAASPFARRFLHRPAYLLLPVTTLAVVGTLAVKPDWSLWALLLPQLVNLLVASIVCADVLAERRARSNDPGAITLLVAAGAAAGGMLTVFVAPYVFTSFAEYPIAVAFVVLARRAPVGDEHATFSPLLDIGLPIGLGLLILAMSRGLNRWAITYSSGDLDVVTDLVFVLGALLALSVRRWPVRFGVAVAAVLLVLSLPLGAQLPELFADRSFFAVDRVTADPVAGAHTLLTDGAVLGQQNTRKHPTAILGYESRSGPAGQIFATPAARNAQRVAVLGLRTGSLACYGTGSQTWSFDERDPAIVSAAEDPERFTFLRDCPPSSSVRLGIERQSLAQTPDQSFGVIVVRAGNGPQPDPSLYTTEAMRLYVSKLAPGGVLSFDVTLGTLDLQQHVADAALTAGAECYARDDLVPSVPRLLAGVFPSSWIACSHGSMDPLGAIRSDPRWHRLVGHALDAWTDGRLPAAEALRLGTPPA
ncbi:MAG TPA: hypothetical protein VGJ67_01255 [Actinomycetota bacterium]